MSGFKVRGVSIAPGGPFFYVGGPCVIESAEMALDHAKKLKAMVERLRLPYVFKSSYDKANRMSRASFRGPGLREGLKILAEVRKKLGLPVLTDVHSPEEAEEAAETVDMLQIPAFLCRQTDLVVAAAKTGKPVNIKKGQFLAPEDMRHIAEKATARGNGKIMLTERGTSFGYRLLVNDMRAIPIMKSFGFAVCFDAGHSVQMPGASDGKSGGRREFISVLARAATAAGADGLFIEAHEKPSAALSDGPNMVALSELPALLKDCLAIRRAIGVS